MTTQSSPPRPASKDAIRASVVGVVSLTLVVLGALSVSDSTASTSAVVISWLPVVVVLVVQSGALLWSTAAPAVVLVVVAFMPLVATFFDTSQISSVTTVPVIVAAFSAGTRTHGMRLWASTISAGVGVATTAAASMDPSAPTLSRLLPSVVLSLLVLGAPLTVAVVVVSRRRMIAALHAEKAAIALTQEARLQVAMAQERTSIARELHDIAAHHMSGIALLSAAVERQVDSAPEAAKAGIRQIRSQSRAVLDDLRQVVGLLRDGGEESTAPYRLDVVPELVAHHISRGDTVELRVTARATGESLGSGLGPLAHITAYRMVQEALANAARHAPGSARAVHIDDSSPEFVRITVTNGPATREPEPEKASGHGLLGMRERSDLVHGTLAYGATSEGGWQVSLRIPTTTHPEEESSP